MDLHVRTELPGIRNVVAGARPRLLSPSQGPRGLRGRGVPAPPCRVIRFHRRLRSPGSSGNGWKAPVQLGSRVPYVFSTLSIRLLAYDGRSFSDAFLSVTVGPLLISQHDIGG
jgi:hypothetical protein